MSTDPNPFADDPPPAARRLQSAADPLDPYAAPAMDLKRENQPQIGLWRDGPLLVMHPQATFPPRCIFTNEPTEIRRRQKLSWSYALDVTHRYLSIEFSVCEAKQRQIVRLRGQRVIIGLICGAPALIALALLVFGYVSCSGLVVIAISLLASALAFAQAGSVGELLEFQSIKDPYFWIKGAQPPFLDSLPEWPG